MFSFLGCRFRDGGLCAAEHWRELCRINSCEGVREADEAKGEVELKCNFTSGLRGSHGETWSRAGSSDLSQWKQGS